MKNTVKRIFCLIMVLTMVFSMAVPAYAEGEVSCTCGTQTEEHSAECAITLAAQSEPQIVPTCTGLADCTVEPHGENCLSLCTKAADCAAKAHQDGCESQKAPEPTCSGLADCTVAPHGENCLSLCTKAADCAAKAHQDGCESQKAPELTCTGLADCTVAPHGENCLSLCTKAADCAAKAHQDGCESQMAPELTCDKTLSCPVTEGHEADCLKAIAEAEAAAAEAKKLADIDAVQAKIDALHIGSTPEEIAAVEAAIGTLLATYGIADPNEVLKMDNYYNPKTLEIPDPVAKIGETEFATLQEAVNTAVNGDTIVLQKDCSEDITISQREGVNIVIDGQINDTTRAKYSGKIVINGNSAYTSDTLIIQNIDFVTSTAEHEFIWSYSQSAPGRYAHNVSIKNCSFTANGAAVKTAAAIKFRQAENITISNCTANGMHSLLQSTGGNNISVTGCTVTGGKNGVSFGTTDNVSVSGTSIEADGYGIRANAEGAYDLTVSNSTVSAYFPVLIREAKAEGYELNVGSDTTLNATNPSKIGIAVSNGDADTVDQLTVPTGSYTVNDNTANTTIYPTDILPQGSGTETAPFVISSLEQLKYFRDKVNANDSTWKNAYVKLGADIDMGNEVWEPIGANSDTSVRFFGVFDGAKADGGMYTISGLKVNLAPEYRGAGLFGSTGGTLQNFIVDGASVSSTSTGLATDNGIAVVAGSLYSSGTISNVHVKNATLNGNRYLGAIAGYVQGNINNCTSDNIKITATPNPTGTSYDNGDKCGGIVGYMGAGSISGCQASNITIYGYRDLGGIVGTISGGSTVSNCSVSGNISLTADQTINYYGDKDFSTSPITGRVVSGSSDNTNVNNATVTVVTKPQVAKIGETTYRSLNEAFAAAKANDTIILIDDATLSKGIECTNDITLDLNGKKIITISECGNPAIRITGGATLNVVDNAGGGSMDSSASGYCFILGASDGTSIGNLNISGGSYKAQTSVASVTKGTLSISGGHFSVEPYNGSYDFLINCIDANYKDGSAKIAVSGGTFENFDPANNAAEGKYTKFAAEEYGSIKDGDNYTVVKTPELPSATVTEIENDDLTMALNFKADYADEKQLEYYGDYYADYVLTLNKPVTFNANGNADGWLSGQYDDFGPGWLNVPFENVSLAAGESIKIMEYAAKLMNKPDLQFTYAMVYDIVKDFDCGIFFDEEFLKANPDLEVNLSLRIYDPAFASDDKYEGIPIGENNEFTNPMTEARYTDANGDRQYGTLKDCLEKVPAGNAVEILSDVSISEPIVIEKSITIDGKGNTLTYSGTDRAIDIPNDNDASNNVNVTVRNLTVEATSAERGINYNENGTLTLEKVNVSAGNYAVNLPGKADGATVSISNSQLSGLNTLNLWGEGMRVEVKNSTINTNEDSDDEDYAPIAVNNDLSTAANDCVITLSGVTVNYIEDGQPVEKPAALNATNSTITTSGCTLSAPIVNVVAICTAGYLNTLQEAVDISFEKNIKPQLLRSVTVDGELVIKGNCSIDANGFVITFDDGASVSFAEGTADDTVLKIEGMDDKLAEVQAALPGMCVYKGSIEICKTHSFSYSDDGKNTITERCTKGCGHSASVTIGLANPKKEKAPYTGAAITDMLKLSYSDNWAGAAPSLSFVKNIIPGDATGTITIGTAEASASFTIVPAELSGEPVGKFYRDSGSSYTFLIKTSELKSSAGLKVISPLSIYTHSGKHVCDVKYFNVTAKDGNLLITVPDYIMAKLGTGRYELSVSLANADDVFVAYSDCQFRVRYPVITPSTGDPANFLLWGGLLLGAMAALGGTVVVLKKKGKQ